MAKMYQCFNSQYCDNVGECPHSEEIYRKVLRVMEHCVRNLCSNDSGIKSYLNGTYNFSLSLRFCPKKKEKKCVLCGLPSAF